MQWQQEISDWVSVFHNPHPSASENYFTEHLCKSALSVFYLLVRLDNCQRKILTGNNYQMVYRCHCETFFSTLLYSTHAVPYNYCKDDIVGKQHNKTLLPANKQSIEIESKLCNCVIVCHNNNYNQNNDNDDNDDDVDKKLNK